MSGPFPRQLRIPPGLVKPDLILGLPRLVWLALFGLGTMPVVFLGKIGLLIEPVTLALGLWMVVEARRDPQFLLAMSGQMGLKDYYE